MKVFSNTPILIVTQHMWSKHCLVKVHFGSLSYISSYPTCSQTGQKSNNFLFKSRQWWKHLVSWGWNAHNGKEKTSLSQRQFDRSQAGDKLLEPWPPYGGTRCTQLLIKAMTTLSNVYLPFSDSLTQGAICYLSIKAIIVKWDKFYSSGDGSPITLLWMSM